MVIAIVAAVLVFAASVLAVAALLFLRPGDDGPSASGPTGAIPGATDVQADGAADGAAGSTTDIALGSGPGATCRPGPAGGFDLAVSGAGPGDQVTVAVDLVDDAGGNHPQLVAAGAADTEGRVAAALPATVAGRAVRSCTVTAVQLGDRVVYAGR